MTYSTLTTPADLWMCKDSASPETKVSIDEYLPLAAVAELVATICGIPTEKAEAFIDAICGQSNLFQAEALWSRLHATNTLEMQRCGFTRKQATKLSAAMELGRRAYTVPSDLPTAITDPADAHQLFAEQLSHKSNERFAALALNVKHRPLGIKVFTYGSDTETLAPPREVFRWALTAGATRLILAHNHPTGDTFPSPEDLKLTDDFIQAGKHINIPILDHLVIGKGNFTSIRQSYPNRWADSQ